VNLLQITYQYDVFEPGHTAKKTTIIFEWVVPLFDFHVRILHTYILKLKYSQSIEPIQLTVKSPTRSREYLFFN
jgi:hypothetical protein